MPRSRSAEATIKGFNFQFDASIKFILESSGPVIIEGVEDVDVFNESGLSECVQCKYYEGTKLTNSILRGIIAPMLKHFKNEKTSKFIVYGFFKDKNIVDLSNSDLTNFKEQVLKYKDDELEKDLQIEIGLVDADLQLFLANLQIQETLGYEQHKSEVMASLALHLSCSINEVKAVYYNNAFSIVSELATKSDISGRTIEKSNFLKKINTKEFLFNHWLLKDKGEVKYCKEIRLQHFTNNNVSPKARFFIIKALGYDKVILKNLILKISNNWSNFRLKRLNADTHYAPYIHISGIHKELLIQLKNELFREGHLFVDGYPFKNSEFSVNEISKTGSSSNKIAFRWVESNFDLETTLKNLDRVTKEVYEFYTEEALGLKCDCKHIKVPIETLSMIEKII